MQTKRHQNNEFLRAAEQHQKLRLSAKYAYMEDYKEVLTQAKEKLKEAKATVTENSIKLANFKLWVQSNKLPSFEDYLNAALMGSK